MRGNSSQDNEIRNMPENRHDQNFARDLEMVTGEINLRISQEIGSLINVMNSQIEIAISSAISERIIPQMQGVVEAVLNRQLGSVSTMPRRPQNVNDDERDVGENDIHTEAKRCFATHDEDIDYFNMRIYIILIACVYFQQFNFVQ